MKQTNDILNTVDRMVDSSMNSILQNILIYKDTNNNYIMYDRYSMKKHNGDVIVDVIGTWTQNKFSSMKWAVTWCVADYRNKISSANRILELDRMLGRVGSQIKLYNILLRKSPPTDLHILYTTKLDEHKIKFQQIMNELIEYSFESEQWQLKQFSMISSNVNKF